MLKVFKDQLLLVLLVMIALDMTSCISSKKVIYLNDLKDSTSVNLNKAQVAFETPIQKNDLLWITVGGSNPSDLVVLNSSNGSIPTTSTAMIPTGGSAVGYLVEADGKIKVPYVGMVQAEGLTRLQLESKLTELFKDYTKNPVVNVRFLNYNFSVIGEVRNSGRFTMPNERITILEALSMAGDMTEFGKRDNILVLREVNGERSIARINLLSKELFKSPYYYLKTNDVVYVEPVNAKFITRTGIPQYLGIVAVGLSLLLTVINTIKIN